jgi:hypothetical protein
VLASVAVLVAGAGAAGCGSDDFENEPRPPAPVELTARVDDRRVVVSPITIEGEPVGAGLANVTISNQTPDSVQLTFAGPSERRTDPIVPGGVLEFKLELQRGNYTVSADDTGIRPFEMAVGPERESAQNDLLLP